jgi:hypothetical protein
MAAEIYRLIPPSEQAHTFRKRIADSDDIDVAEPSHVALGLGGYMYTPAVYASGLVIWHATTERKNRMLNDAETQEAGRI